MSDTDRGEFGRVLYTNIICWNMKIFATSQAMWAYGSGQTELGLLTPIALTYLLLDLQIHKNQAVNLNDFGPVHLIYMNQLHSLN